MGKRSNHLFFKRCEEFANQFLDQLYAFEEGPVLFKPTKCEIEQFIYSRQEVLFTDIYPDMICMEYTILN